VSARFAGGGEIVVVAVHLNPSNEEIRRLEASVLIRHVEEALARSATVVVLGDFNSSREEAFHEELRRLGFVNAVEARGGGLRRTRVAEPAKEPCVDHVYVSRALAPLLSAASVLDGSSRSPRF
jgi:endonuclease/exonuclease/phosphatase family metal-dependent hydrolase